MDAINNQLSTFYRSMHKSPTPEPFAHLHLAVPPLPFDSEDQLLSVLARLRAQLSLALAQKWSTQGGDPALLPSINNFVINVPIIRLAYNHSLAPGILRQASAHHLQELYHKGSTPSSLETKE